jgi:hypothetical protein
VRALSDQLPNALLYDQGLIVDESKKPVNSKHSLQFETFNSAKIKACGTIDGHDRLVYPFRSKPNVSPASTANDFGSIRSTGHHLALAAPDVGGVGGVE